ncbi:MAG: hypothetical protein GXY39_07935 [Actinomycetales bacterium]|nr:hypothetical protein [Tetrasphaera sp.]NLW99623.1 hypothetical protein [Actinomycetales bacterium]
MQTLHWVALVLALVGGALIVVGIQQQRASAPSNDIVGGFGGPAGSSDVGLPEGYEAPDPHAHFAVGRTARLAGLVLVLVALGLLVYNVLV